MIKAVRAHNALLKLVKKDNKKVSAAKERASFMKNPHSFAKNLLFPMDSGQPTFEQKLADLYFPATYSNKRTSEEITAHEDLQRPNSPRFSFDSSFPDLGHFTRLLKRKSNKSAGGINGNRYRSDSPLSTYTVKYLTAKIP